MNEFNSNLRGRTTVKRSIPWLTILSAMSVFIVMGGMAWVLFKERMMNFDPSFFSFLMIQEESFSPALNRYGSILSQILPLILIKAGASLETVLRYYSLSFVLLYVIYLLFVGVVLRDRKGVVALTIALTLTFRETFYYSTAELYQAIGLSIVLWSLFSHALKQLGSKRIVELVACGLLVIGISFFHQLGLLMTFFVLSFEYIRRGKWKDYRALVTISWSLLWFLAAIKLFTTSEYEQERLLSVDTFFQQIGNLTSLKSYLYFRDFAHNHLLVPSVLFGAALIYLLIKKKWILTSYLILYVFAFITVVIVALHHEGSPIMLQNYFTVLGLFAGLLIAISLENKSKWLVALCVFGIGFYSLREIYQSRYDYQTRTQFVEEISKYGQQFPEKKYVMHAQHLPWEYVWVSWAVPFETLMMSEMKSDLETVTYYPTFELDTMDGYDIERPEAFLGPSFAPHWWTAPSLNPEYFSVKSSPYRILNSIQIDSVLTDSLLQSSDLMVSPHLDTLNRSAGRNTMKIDFINNTADVIRSIPISEESGLHFYYRTVTQEGESGAVTTRRLLFDMVPGKPYTHVFPYQHPWQLNSKLEMGLFLKSDSLFFPKAIIHTNVQ